MKRAFVRIATSAALGLVFVAPVASGSPPARGPAGKPRPAKETGDHGGRLVKLGPGFVEVVVWERRIDVFLYDGAAKRIGTHGHTLKLEVTREPPPAEGNARSVLDLTPWKERFRAPIDMEGAEAASLTFTLTAGEETYTAQHRWKRGEDRSRLDDSRTPFIAPDPGVPDHPRERPVPPLPLR